jgi:hypothetical protein
LDGARWLDYPEGERTLSVSGLIVHVLHQCGRQGLEDLDREWLSNLPGVIPTATEKEASNKTIYDKNGRRVGTDDSRYYVLPWLIAATADAYPSGSDVQRASAREWISSALRRRGGVQEGIKVDGSDDWIAAELLYALAYLDEDHQRVSPTREVALGSEKQSSPLASVLDTTRH